MVDNLIRVRIEKLADVSAFEAVPLAERGLASSTYDVILNALNRFADRDALIFMADPKQPDLVERWSYQALHDAVARSARMFAADGVTRDDVVSILMPNLPQFHFAFWGAEAAGIANPINPLQTADAIIDLLRAAGTKVLVTLSPLLDAELGAKVAAIAASGLNIKVYTVGAPGESFADFDEARRAYSTAPLEQRPRGSDIAALFQTGGTTGRPKLARHTHANEVFMAWTIANALTLEPGHTLLCGLPLFHVNGVFVTGLTPFTTGASVLMATREGYRHRDLVPNFWHVVERHRISHFSAVPAIVSALMDVPLANADVSSLVYVLCGAAPLPASLMRRFEATFDLKILEGYGLTEGTCASALNPAHGKRPVGAVGLRIPYQQIEIRHADENGRYTRKAGLDEAGAIHIRGPNVFAGYIDDVATRMVLDADGWFNTGDLGRIDEHGYLWLSGRSKDLIIRGGHNIDPEVIEEGLSAHPSVSQVAAVGLPDLRVGELPAAYVSLCEGASVTIEDLLEHCATSISERAARPVRIEIIDKLPLTAVGKIFKPELRRRLTQDVMQAQLQKAGLDASVAVELSDRYGLQVWLDVPRQSDVEHARAVVGDFPFQIDLASDRPG